MSQTSVPLDSIGKVQDVDKIVDAELARVKSQDDAMKQDRSTRDRQSNLLRSSSQRAQEYSALVGVSVLVLTACAVLATANTFLDSGIISMLIVIVFAGGCIWVYLGYMRIAQRDKTDFDQVGSGSLIDPVKLITPTTADMISAGVTGTGAAIVSPVLACTGKECCNELAGTVWDPNTYRCIVKSDKTVRVQNASFELPTIAANTYIGPIALVPSWLSVDGADKVVSGKYFYVVNGADSYFNKGKKLPANTTQCVAIQQSAPKITLSQTVQIAYAGTYLLSFYACPRYYNYLVEQQLTASIGGVSRATALVPTSDWTEYTVAFVVTTPGPHPLTFITTSSKSGDTSIMLTKISITEVQPSTGKP